MIEIDHLTKRFGPITAVDDVSFFVAQGEVVGFLGPNGAGKSTTMKMATGFLRPTLGTARICDFDVLEDPIEVKQRIGYLPEGAPMWPDMTTAAFLRFIARVRGFDGAEVDEKIAQAIDKTQLASVLEQPIETLSKGYKRRVGLAQALLHDPEVLILDEPTDGLDPNQKHEVRELIHGMSEDKAIVVSTHILEEVEAVCSRAVIIAKGRIVADDTPEELLKKAPDHNAVIIRAADLVAVRAALSGVDGVDGIEDLDQARISVRPSSDAPVVDAVGAALREGRFGRRNSCRARPSRRRVQANYGDGLEDMRNTFIVFEREMASYFSTPLAYVFIIIFLALSGALTFFAGGFFESDQASLITFFNFHGWLYLILIPAISMRLWAEERRNGTIELLMTLPVTLMQAILGKFLAAWCFAGVALSLTFPIWITVNYLGEPDNGVILAGYFGSLLMAGGFLAIGSFVSALTKNQVIAFVVAAAICFLFIAMGTSVVINAFAEWAPGWLMDFIRSLSFSDHYAAIMRGKLDLRDVFYFVSIIVLFLFLNGIAVERSKASS